DQLALAAAGIEALSRELSAAVRAAEVPPALAEAERTADALIQARAAEAQARDVAAADPDATAAELRAHGQEHVTTFGRVEPLRSLSEQAAAEDHAAAAARDVAATLAAQVDSVGRQAAAQREPAREAGERLPGFQPEAERYRQAAEDTAKLIQARTDVARQSAAYVAAKIEHADLLTEAARLRLGGPA